MRAVVCTDYGPPDVLQLRDVPKPVPKDNEVLVRIRATTVSAADCELRRFDFAPWIWVPIRLAFGIRRPRRPVLGQELAGDVESVGKDDRSLRKGDLTSLPTDSTSPASSCPSTGCLGLRMPNDSRIGTQIQRAKSNLRSSQSVALTVVARIRTSTSLSFGTGFATSLS